MVIIAATSYGNVLFAIIVVAGTSFPRAVMNFIVERKDPCKLHLIHVLGAMMYFSPPLTSEEQYILTTILIILIYYQIHGAVLIIDY